MPNYKFLLQVLLVQSPIARLMEKKSDSINLVDEKKEVAVAMEAIPSATTFSHTTSDSKNKFISREHYAFSSEDLNRFIIKDPDWSLYLKDKDTRTKKALKRDMKKMIKQVKKILSLIDMPQSLIEPIILKSGFRICITPNKARSGAPANVDLQSKTIFLNLKKTSDAYLKRALRNEFSNLLVVTQLQEDGISPDNIYHPIIQRCAAACFQFIRRLYIYNDHLGLKPMTKKEQEVYKGFKEFVTPKFHSLASAPKNPSQWSKELSTALADYTPMNHSWYYTGSKQDIENFVKIDPNVRDDRVSKSINDETNFIIAEPLKFKTVGVVSKVDTDSEKQKLEFSYQYVATPDKLFVNDIRRRLSEYYHATATSRYGRRSTIDKMIEFLSHIEEIREITPLLAPQFIKAMNELFKNKLAGQPYVVSDKTTQFGEYAKSLLFEASGASSVSSPLLANLMYETYSTDQLNSAETESNSPGPKSKQTVID